MYKIAIENGELSWAERWQYSLIPLFMVIVTSFYAFRGFLSGIQQVTHCAMMGGLFSSEPIFPLQKDNSWALRSSPTEISEYVAKKAMETGKAVDAKQCGIDCANSYSTTTTEAMALSEKEANHLSRTATLHNAFSVMSAGEASKNRRRNSKPTSSFYTL